MKIRLFTLFILMSLTLIPYDMVQAGPTYQHTGNSALDVVVAKAMQQDDLPGASVAVLKNGSYLVY